MISISRVTDTITVLWDDRASRPMACARASEGVSAIQSGFKVDAEPAGPSLPAHAASSPFWINAYAVLQPDKRAIVTGKRKTSMPCPCFYPPPWG